MALDILLGFWPKLLFFSGAEATDVGSTHFVMSRVEGARELDSRARAYMKSEGVNRGLLKVSARNFAIFGSAFALDYLLGVQDNAFSVSTGTAYGLGSVKYLAGIHNFARYHGYEKVADVAGFLPALLIKLNPLVKGIRKSESES